MIRIVFLLIASLGVLAALGTVLARNLVHAALFLVAFFFLVACQFILLEVDFLAAIQVLIYIGAVAILLLFGIMLTRNIQGDETTEGGLSRWIPGSLVALALLGLLIAGIRQESGLGVRPAWGSIVSRPEFSPVDDVASDRPRPVDPRATALSSVAKSVGVEMMTRYVVAFEVAGLLLTAAIVGAIALAAGDRSSRPGTARDASASLNSSGGPIEQPGSSATTAPTSVASTPR